MLGQFYLDARGGNIMVKKREHGGKSPSSEREYERVTTRIPMKIKRGHPLTIMGPPSSDCSQYTATRGLFDFFMSLDVLSSIVQFD
jgi:hypothetical protein